MISQCICVCAVVLTMVGGPHPISAQAQERAEEDARIAIKAVLDKIGHAWLAESEASVFLDGLSDQAYTMAFPLPDKPQQALVLNKQGYGEFFEQLVQNARPRKHEHRIKSVTVKGQLAYEVGTITRALPTGPERRLEHLNIFVQEKAAWKLVFSGSVIDIRQALRGDAMDEQAVRKLAEKFVAAFRLKNPVPFEQLEALLAENIVAVMSGGMVVEGKHSLAEYYRAGLEELREDFTTFSLVYDIRSVTLLGDGAIVFGKLRMDGVLKEDNTPFHREVWETLVFQKNGSNWKIIQEHSTKADEKKAPAS